MESSQTQNKQSIDPWELNQHSQTQFPYFLSESQEQLTKLTKASLSKTKTQENANIRLSQQQSSKKLKVKNTSDVKLGKASSKKYKYPLIKLKQKYSLATEEADSEMSQSIDQKIIDRNQQLPSIKYPMANYCNQRKEKFLAEKSSSIGILKNRNTLKITSRNQSVKNTICSFQSIKPTEFSFQRKRLTNWIYNIQQKQKKRRDTYACEFKARNSSNSHFYSPNKNCAGYHMEQNRVQIQPFEPMGNILEQKVQHKLNLLEEKSFEKQCRTKHPDVKSKQFNKQNCLLSTNTQLFSNYCPKLIAHEVQDKIKQKIIDQGGKAKFKSKGNETSTSSIFLNELQKYNLFKSVRGQH